MRIACSGNQTCDLRRRVVVNADRTTATADFENRKTAATYLLNHCTSLVVT